MYPGDRLEYRHGARVIERSGQEGYRPVAWRHLTGATQRATPDAGQKTREAADELPVAVIVVGDRRCLAHVARSRSRRSISDRPRGFSEKGCRFIERPSFEPIAGLRFPTAAFMPPSACPIPVCTLGDANPQLGQGSRGSTRIRAAPWLLPTHNCEGFTDLSTSTRRMFVLDGRR